jgi:uncharacterized membrane protein
MLAYFEEVRRAVGTGELSWMMWNLCLAAVPLGLSTVLFVRSTRRSFAWWLGVATFVLFLPNAPYVLTDVIHLIEAIESDRFSSSAVLLGLIPLYAAFMALGFGAYVVCLMHVGAYLRRIGLGSYVTATEVGLHALAALGIYLGRFERLNSWSVATWPGGLARTLTDVMTTRPLVVITLTFLLLAALYAACKWLLLAGISFRRFRREDSAAN